MNTALEFSASASDLQPVPSARVLGRLGFLKPTDSKPAIYIQPMGEMRKSQLPDEAYETREVWIDDIRGRTAGLSLDREGLVVLDQRSAVRSWLDEEQITDIYYAEAIELIKQQTGAREVLVFDHTVRALAEQDRAAHRTRETVGFMHADYTPRSGPQRIRDFFGAAGQELGANDRVAFYNLWRPINDAAEANPLAYVDATTLELDSLVATDLIYPERTGEVFHQTYNPRHRHVYLSNQTPDEVTMFKTFDTREDVTRFIPHGAFHKLTGPRPEGDRMSIELRAIALF